MHKTKDAGENQDRQLQGQSLRSMKTRAGFSARNQQEFNYRRHGPDVSRDVWQ